MIGSGRLAAPLPPSRQAAGALPSPAPAAIPLLLVGRPDMTLRSSDVDGVDMVILPPVRDLGDGFTVRRALPSAHRRMVGPFIFLDQMGPVALTAGQGLDVRPHPHIGL